MTKLFVDPVIFENHGQNIVGLLHVPSDPKPPVVVMCHGWTGNMHSHGLFVRCADTLCNEGFMVLRFDFRGSEHSDGDFSQITVSGEVSDLRKTLKMIKQLGYDTSRLGVLGYSLGGLVAVKGMKKEGKAMVLWAPTSNPVEEFRQILGSRRIGILERKGYTWFTKDPSPYRRKVRFKVGRPFWLELQHMHPIAEIKDVRCPVRVIHGVDDDLVNHRHSNELMKHITAKSDLKLIEGANHFFDKPEHIEKLINLTTNWFKKWI